MVKGLQWVGISLIVISILGFLTVADDLRHKGELIGVGSILLFGLVMLLLSLYLRGKSRRELP